MADATSEAQGPDLAAGVPASKLAAAGMLQGRVGPDDVLLVREGERVFAVGAYCTHYHGALVDGLVVDGSVRCPLHHACFSLASGAALRAPALAPLDRWRVERVGDTLFVREKLPDAPAPSAPPESPSSIVIVGGGAAGLAAADTLRKHGYAGPVAMISADADPPVDRPNLSKDYLEGTAQEDWIPLWPSDRFAEERVELILGTRVTSIDPTARTLTLENGARRDYGALLLATGAEPVRLAIPGGGANVLLLRSFADSRAIVARVANAKRVVVVGASFIGLEVAASLRGRGIAVDVVAPDRVPLERVMGPDVGAFVKSVHESRGVVFHLEETVASIDGRTVRLSGGGTLDADFVVAGIGVRPSLALAEMAGLALDRGVVVNEFLETSAPGVFAAGDIARWPDPHSGAPIRVEHWVVAERQGQAAARNMLGLRERFDAVPFFWSQHYDVTIRYVGHAEQWDAARVDGSLAARDATVTFTRGGRTLAVATIGRDRACLEAERALEQLA